MTEFTCDISGSTLVDFDWKVKYVVGSSKIAAIGAPLVSLSLHCSENGTVKDTTEVPFKTVTLEMTKDELKSLLTTLEKTQENM